MLFVFGVSYVCIFPQGAYVHEYWAYYTYPAVALLAAAPFVVLMRMSVAWKPLHRHISRGAYAALVCALCVIATVKTLRLEAERGTNAFASAYNIAAITHSISPDTVIVAEEILDHPTNTRIPFYLSNYVEFAAICPANAQVAHQRGDPAAFLMDSKVPLGTPKYNFYEKIRVHCGFFMETVVRGSPVRKFDATTGEWRDLWQEMERDVAAPKVAAPKDVEAEYRDGVIVVRWTHPAPEKIQAYKIYARSDAQIFYVSGPYFFYGLNGAVASVDMNKAVINVKLKQPVWIIVTAVDDKNNESGFDKPVRVAP
jgi:hypothetical protein